MLENRCNIEHLIMDGGSSDKSDLVAGKYANSWFKSEPDLGMYDALAKGLPHTTGSIIGYLNAGDTLLPWAFDVLLDIFSDSNVAWVSGYSTLMNVRGEVTAAWKPPRYRRQFVLNGFYADPSYPHCIQQESTFWSRSLHESVNWEKFKSFKYAGDYFLWSQFAKVTDLHSVMTLLGSFLIHPNQLSENRSDYNREIATFVRRPTCREVFTRWWEIDCPALLRGRLWNATLKKSPACIYDYSPVAAKWVPR